MCWTLQICQYCSYTVLGNEVNCGALILCFTCTYCCDHSIAIVFRMTRLFTNHSVAYNYIIVDVRGEDMAYYHFPCHYM